MEKSLDRIKSITCMHSSLSNIGNVHFIDFFLPLTQESASVISGESDVESLNVFAKASTSQESLVRVVKVSTPKAKKDTEKKREDSGGKSKDNNKNKEVNILDHFDFLMVDKYHKQKEKKEKRLDTSIK